MCKSLKNEQMADITIGCSHHIEISTPAGARTLDTLNKSQVLYQLSYKRSVMFLFDVRLQGLEPWTP